MADVLIPWETNSNTTSSGETAEVFWHRKTYRLDGKEQYVLECVEKAEPNRYYRVKSEDQEQIDGLYESMIRDATGLLDATAEELPGA